MEQEQKNNYVQDFDWPVEKLFLTPKQKERLDSNRQKFEATRQFLLSFKDNPEMSNQLEKFVLSGKLLSPGEYTRIASIIKALERLGERYDPPASLVSPNGDAVIMSANCAEKMGFVVDGYITNDELADLVSVLRAEGVSEEGTNRIKAAMSRQGVVIMQRGGLVPLREYLEESGALQTKRETRSIDEIEMAMGGGGIRSRLVDRHYGFYEYIKEKNPQQYDKVLKIILKDPAFAEIQSELLKSPAYAGLDEDALALLILADKKFERLISAETEEALDAVVAQSYKEFMAKINKVQEALNKNEKMKRLRGAILTRVNANR